MLILVFIFSQNKQLMEDVKPVLDFLEEHKGAVEVLEKMLSRPASAETSAATDQTTKENKTENCAQETEKEKTQSPLEGIANESILNGIRAYLNSQAR